MEDEDKNTINAVADEAERTDDEVQAELDAAAALVEDDEADEDKAIEEHVADDEGAKLSVGVVRGAPDSFELEALNEDVGRIVRVFDGNWRGGAQHVAIITAIDESNVISATVFPNGDLPYCVAGFVHIDDLDDADVPGYWDYDA